MTREIVNTLDVPARILMAGIFITAGIGKLTDPEATIDYMQSFGLPGFLYYPTIIFEIGAGLMLAYGLFIRGVAFLLAGFTIVSGLLFHRELGDPDQMVMLLKNMAIAGGLLMFTKHGAASLALDDLIRPGTALPAHRTD